MCIFQRLSEVGACTSGAQSVRLAIWQGKKDSNLRMLESKSSALTNLATPLHGLMAQRHQPINYPAKLSLAAHPTKGWTFKLLHNLT